MLKRYLNNDPFSWMLDSSDPSIRYLTEKEILGATDYNDEYRQIEQSDAITKLLPGGGTLLGKPSSFDQHYRGTMWCFSEAIERGLDLRTPFVHNTAHHIIQHWQLESGGFTINSKPYIEVSCITGGMVRYLIKAGFQGNPVDKGIDWILRHQRHDGGWLHCPLGTFRDQLKLLLFKRTGKGCVRDDNKEIPSCIYATASCAMALLEYNKTSTNCSVSSHLEKIHDFYRKRIYNTISASSVPRKNHLWDEDFSLLGYPVLSQFDILNGLIFSFENGFIHDPETINAFNLIISKQNVDGSWNRECLRSGMIHNPAEHTRRSTKDKWVTLNALRLLKHADRTEGISHHK